MLPGDHTARGTYSPSARLFWDWRLPVSAHCKAGTQAHVLEKKARVNSATGSRAEGKCDAGAIEQASDWRGGKKNGFVFPRQKKPPTVAEVWVWDMAPFTPSSGAFFSKKGGTKKIVSLAASDKTEAEGDEVSASGSRVKVLFIYLGLNGVHLIMLQISYSPELCVAQN